MDTRRSFYLASRRNDFDVPAPDEFSVDLADIPCITPANDNVQTEERLSARCGATPSPSDRAAWSQLIEAGHQ
jgi:hypothetical protein